MSRKEGPVLHDALQPGPTPAVPLTNKTWRAILKQWMVHSEKLATTGEVAAVIAHEMCNLLTSVKGWGSPEATETLTAYDYPRTERGKGR